MANQWKPPTCDCSVEDWHTQCVHHDYAELQRSLRRPVMDDIEWAAFMRRQHVLAQYDPAKPARDW